MGAGHPNGDGRIAMGGWGIKGKMAGGCSLELAAVRAKVRMNINADHPG
jgi:hypothetical protein